MVFLLNSSFQICLLKQQQKPDNLFLQVGAKFKLSRTQTGQEEITNRAIICLLYTSPSPRDRTRSRMPSSA